MAKKGKNKIANGKGLKGALARHGLSEQNRKNIASTISMQNEKKLLKEKSIKSGKVSKNRNKIQPQQKGLIPFNKEDKLLLVGEGDFSFAVSIIKEGYIKPYNLIATSYDSNDELLRKYPNAADNLKYLVEEGVNVRFEIDAMDLSSSLKLNSSARNKRSKTPNHLFTDKKNLNYIMFNFPHTGRGMKDMDRNIRDHQKLVLGFLQSCTSVFNLVNNDIQNDFAGYQTNTSADNNGKVILSLFDGEPYASWNIKILGRSEGLVVERSGKFDWSLFPHYAHKRTNGVRDTTKPASERDARIYIFQKFSKDGVNSKKKSVDSDSDDN